MKSLYLRTLTATLTLGAACTVAFTYTTDAFGIYGDATKTSLSRINQFYYMRSSKPLVLLKKQPRSIIAGSSRAARLTPSYYGLNNYYNASIPGATPKEVRQIIEFSHSNGSLQSALIGWDFEAFLSLTPPIRDGFNSKLITASNPLELAIQTAVAHIRTSVSFTAILESIRASSANISDPSASYLPDGSWHRNQTHQQIKSDFFEISKQKTIEFRKIAKHRIDTTEIHNTLDFCYKQKLNCQIFATPVHLVHFEIFSKFGLVKLWRKWHWEIVKINRKLANRYGVEEIDFWGFNATTPAVNAPVHDLSSLKNFWFEDNLHFQPSLGSVILETTVLENSHPQAFQLTHSNVNAYLNRVARLQKQYVADDPAMIKSLRRSLNVLEANLP